MAVAPMLVFKEAEGKLTNTPLPKYPYSSLLELTRDVRIGENLIKAWTYKSAQMSSLPWRPYP